MIDLSSLIFGDRYIVDRPDYPDQVSAICKGAQVSSIDEDTGMGCFEYDDGSIATIMFTVVPTPA